MTQSCQQEICVIRHVSCNTLLYNGLVGLSYSAGPMTGSERFGANLKEWRVRRKLNQDVLGERVGADGPRISRLESGQENPTLETIDRLAAILQVDVSVFHVPRPEEGLSRDDGRPSQGSEVLNYLLQSLDSEAPAEDSWQGDILKAIAALNRALRRADPGASTGPAAKVGP